MRVPEEVPDAAWNDLGQGLTNRGPQAKSGSLPGSVSKVLLGHSYALPFIDYGYFSVATAESSSCDRDPMASKAPNIYSLALY